MNIGEEVLENRDLQWLRKVGISIVEGGDDRRADL